MHTLSAKAKVDLVCQHHAGYWNALSADQFGEQTAIRIGKGALKGVTLSPELVSESSLSLSICVRPCGLYLFH